MDKSFIKIHESEYGDTPLNFHIAKDGNTLSIDLTYPPYIDATNGKDKCRYIQVNQESVRASDGLRLHYDFERDGFVVEQASTFRWSIEDKVRDPDWQEVGFFKSWNREKETEFDD